MVKKSAKSGGFRAFFNQFCPFSNDLREKIDNRATLSELTYGAEKSPFAKKNRAALEEFVLPLDIIAFDDMASYHYGPIRAYLEKKGPPILDRFIHFATDKPNVNRP